ncbi:MULTISPECIES: helix-turn-helix domain-containing protein [Chitinophagaceae]
MRDYHKYLAKTSIEDQWGLYITTAGYSTIKKNQAYPLKDVHPQTHTFTWNKGRILNDYYLVFITKGAGVFETEYQSSVLVQEGACFFLYPGVWHRYRPDARVGWEEYWMGFNGYYSKRLMETVFLNQESPIVHTGLNSELLQAFQQLIETIKKAHPGYHQIISAKALQILSLVHNAFVYKEENADDTLQYISKAKFLLQDALDREINMTQIAQKLTVSYSKFRKDFKQVTGVSPNQYHLNLRLSKAEELLSASSIPIGEISDQTGFETLFYFSRIFKKKYGHSPKTYRLMKSN